MKNTIKSEKLIILAGIIAGALFLEIAIPPIGEADYISDMANAPLLLMQENSLLSISEPIVSEKMQMVITAYSSTVWETDSDPLVTASGDTVEDGIVANNMLPFGTKIRIPEVFGNKVFVVKDRMNKRKGDNHLDIWFPEHQLAKNFGVKISYVEILEI